MAHQPLGLEQKHRKPRAHPAVKILAGGLVLLFLCLPWIRLNLSASMPLGLYRLHRVSEPLRYGQAVLLDIPEALRPWWPSRMALLKPVAGLPGDVLIIVQQRFYINGDDYGPVFEQAAGLALPRLPVPMVVREGEVCLASKVMKSLDCRYSGPVPVERITAVATLFWTWEGE